MCFSAEDAETSEMPYENVLFSFSVLHIIKVEKKMFEAEVSLSGQERARDVGGRSRKAMHVCACEEMS